MDASLLDRIERMAATPVLLVASDFDGTLAELVDDPRAVTAHAGALAAIARLKALPHTHTAVISGRALSDLRERLGGVSGLALVGGHGAEVDGVAAAPITPEAGVQLEEAAARFEALALQFPGTLVERKARGVAFHYRRLRDEDAARALSAAGALADGFAALTRRMGSMVIELLADTTTKADGLARVRYDAGATGVVFIGDDLTDEHAFAALKEGDLGIKVGPGDTQARARVQGVAEVAEVLGTLVRAREKWLAGRRMTAINRYSVLSDQRTLALVTPEANVAWLCLPRLDSPAMFAELLDGPAAGGFSIAPVEAAGEPVQSYERDSMVLVTRWPGVSVTDYMDCGFGRAFQRAGRSDLVRVIEGSVRCVVRFAPRLDFGRVATRLIAREQGLQIEGSSDHLLLYSPGVAWRIVDEGVHQTAVAEVDPSRGAVVMELRAGTVNERPHPTSEGARRESTKKFWSAWAGSLVLPRVATEEVRRSALIVRSLVHGPSGAIAAAGTTSLPEHLGGVRNWDYRYCWPRDAAMAAAALVRLGNTGTAMRFLDWLARVVDRCESPDRLRPIYTVEGQDLSPEAEIGHLSGYGESRPVRISNAAAQQVQLDVFGPITDLVALLVERGAPISPDHWRMTRAMVAAVAERWREADHGIWEIRGPREHNVHSKAMCFSTVDRAMVVHEYVIGRENAAWKSLREEIRSDVIKHGFNASRGAFTAVYGGDKIDAAALTLGLCGLVDVRDEAYRLTVDAVERELYRGGGVYRYLYDDGLPGREGAFHLCTGWLVEALARLGQRERAERVFSGLLAAAGPTGVMAEEVDTRTGMPLGNVPQAYSHLALINAAVRLDELSG